MLCLAQLRPCPNIPAYCGSLDRPLDPSGSIPGRISIHFEYYPHSASCADDVPPLRLVPRFALHVADLEPAAAAEGNRAGAAQLRWVQAAVQTAGDVLARLSGNSTGQGVGLRGGTFRVVNDASAIHVGLDQVRWTEDLAVSGKIDKPAARSGTVHALLHLAGAQEFTGDLTVEWPEGTADAVASIHGRLGGVPVLASAPAP
jgi:hypothetical protein